MQTEETIEMAALKAEFQQKLENLKQCSYKDYECTQLSLEGFAYCLRHILQDKSAPFKQCSFVYANNGKHCHLPAPIAKEKKENANTPNLCAEHALRSHLANSKRNTRYPQPPTAESYLTKLSHYVKRVRPRTISTSTTYSEEGADEEGKVTKCLDPFVDVDVRKQLASTSNILEMCSESDSDVEAANYSGVWHDAHADSSEDESIDSEQEDLLKHANIYTAEEVTLITRDKLIRLQSLYIDQYRHLQYMLRERRRRYLHALKREKESYCSINSQMRDNPKEQRLFKKLKAYNSYHKHFGVEAICSKRVRDRRIKMSEPTVRNSGYSKCLFTEGGVKCGEKSMPVARYCRKHILEDTNQVLFRSCGKMCADIKCSTPVEEIFEGATCRLHMELPSVRSYSLVRKDSESDYEEVADHAAVKVEPVPMLPNPVELSHVDASSSAMMFHTPDKSSSSTETAMSGSMSPLELKEEADDFGDFPTAQEQHEAVAGIKVEEVNDEVVVNATNVREEAGETAMEIDVTTSDEPLATMVVVKTEDETPVDDVPMANENID